MAPHDSHIDGCSICQMIAASKENEKVIYEDDQWLCSHCEPAPLAGWIMFYSQARKRGRRCHSRPPSAVMHRESLYKSEQGETYP